MKRTLRIAVAALLTAFIALSPKWLLEGVRREGYRTIYARPAATWHGRIELWHIAGFRVYQGSVTDYLQQRADAYCKKHPGVHIDVVGLTLEQYGDRLSRGVFPDAYSFPAGLVYPEQLGALVADAAAFCGNLAPARQSEAAYAVPYLMSGYFLAANTQLLTKYGSALPEEASRAYLQSALDLDADTPQLAMPAIHAARLGLTGELALEDAFARGECMLAVLSARALGDLLRGEKAALLIDAMPLPDYTDEVMYIGPGANASDAQSAEVAGFASFLLTEEEQLRLTTLGALPVTKVEGKPAYAEELLSELYAAYASPVSPQPFLYQRHRAALAEEAIAALSGDESAKASFFERLAVVENGKL